VSALHARARCGPAAPPLPAVTRAPSCICRSCASRLAAACSSCSSSCRRCWAQGAARAARLPAALRGRAWWARCQARWTGCCRMWLRLMPCTSRCVRGGCKAGVQGKQQQLGGCGAVWSGACAPIMQWAKPQGAGPGFFHTRVHTVRPQELSVWASVKGQQQQQQQQALPCSPAAPGSAVSSQPVAEAMGRMARSLVAGYQELTGVMAAFEAIRSQHTALKVRWGGFGGCCSWLSVGCCDGSMSHLTPPPPPLLLLLHPCGRTCRSPACRSCDCSWPTRGSTFASLLTPPPWRLVRLCGGTAVVTSDSMMAGVGSLPAAQLSVLTHAL
jgi:hypothetical protein